MGKRSTKLNVLTSLILQIITILNGLIVPRIILTMFGSQVNGLTASLGQFLNYITLLEGGVSGVVLASLYKPLAEGDDEKVSGIIKATNVFFRKIALIFVVYSLGVGVIYPLVVDTAFSWGYVFALTMILAASLFVQYFFALAYRLLLNADRRGYLVSVSQIGFVLLNLVLILVSVYIYPNIHVLKLVGVIAYITQPIIYTIYISKHYKIDKQIEADETALKQRWDGFGQNIAFFIHSNTDMVILTIFTTLGEVSVYAVYLMVANSLKSLVMSISSAIAPSMGNVLVGANENDKQKAFDLYEYGIGLVSIFMFTCGALLVVPFVSVYTAGITDVNYYRPLFGILLVAAEGVYCFRDPYVNIAYAAGHFKQTAKYAYVEAGINIVLSIVFVHRYGIIGVAIGTLVAMIYRAIAHVIYLKKHILHRPIKSFVQHVWFWGIIVVTSALVVSFIKFTIESFGMWLVQAIVTALIVGVTLIIFSLLLKKEIFFAFITKLTGGKKN